jgi:hypothetical protein
MIPIENVARIPSAGILAGRTGVLEDEDVGRQG